MVASPAVMSRSDGAFFIFFVSSRPAEFLN